MIIHQYTISQTDVTVDFQTEYQTIDGFGGYGAAREFFYGTVSGYPNWYTQQFAEFLIDDMGQTVIRVNMVGSFNYKEGTFDPNMHLPNFQNNGANAQYNETYSNLKNDGSYLNSSIPFIKAMDSTLRTRGDSLKLLLSLWSPPAWMKDNNDFMRGKLLPEHYDEFADFIVNYIKTYEANSGVKVYCVSLQNEPNLGHPQWTLGCVYNGAEYKAMVDSVHQKMVAEGINHVKIIAPETVKFLDRMKNMLNPFIGDSVSSSHIDMFCSHSYGGDGISLSSGTASEWNDMYTYTRKIGNGNLWMTETGFNTDGWTGAMTDARRIYGALKYGKVSSWIWWTNGHFRGMEKGNISNSQLSYYSSKNFFRYIRPGATQIKTDFSNSNLGIITFSNHDKGDLTIVMLNNNSIAENVTFTNTDFPETWQAYRSSVTEKCVSLGELTGKSFNLPAQSITTIVYSSGIPRPHVGFVRDTVVLKNSAPVKIKLAEIRNGVGVSNPLSINATSSNPEVVDDPIIDYTYPSDTALITLNVLPEASGSSEISIVAEDNPGEFFGKQIIKFNLKVLNEINTPPTIDPINDTLFYVSLDTQFVPFSGVTDGNIDEQEVFFSVKSSNASKIRTVEVSDSGYWFIAKAVGEATITITLSDDGGIDLGGVNTKIISFKIRVEQGTDIEYFKADKPEIFPNPAKNHFTIKSNSQSDKLEIKDLNGRTVLVRNSLQITETIALHSLKPGLYLVETTRNNSKYITKLIISR